MVGKTFSSLPARDLRSKGLSAVDICATMAPLRTMRWSCFPPSIASDKHRLMLSGLIPMSVPLKVFPLVVTTATVLSANAATSVKYFLCATDNFSFSLIVTSDCDSTIYL